MLGAQRRGGFCPRPAPLNSLACATPTPGGRVAKLGAMTKPAQPKLIEIFRAGRHTDTNGQVVEITRDDIVQMAANYSPEKGEAPFVVGHPKLNHPAYGWVKSLKAEGDLLLAEHHQVDTAFAAEVNAGRLKKKSASLFPPTHPNNPVPGQWYLRHVGFLGAAPQAVTGLRDYTFAADDADTVEFGIEDRPWWAFGVLGRLLRRQREKIIETEGVETADQVIPSWEIESIEEAARPASEAATHRAFAADVDVPAQEDVPADQATADLAARDAALTARERDLQAREDRLKEEADRAARTDAAEFASGLVKAGKVLPGNRAAVVELLMVTAGIPQPLTFAAAEGGAEETKPAHQVLREFLESQPAVISFSERSGRTDSDATTVSFAAPPGSQADPSQLELHARAKAHHAAHPELTFLQAVRAVGG
jgi:hypothetical protein